MNRNFKETALVLATLVTVASAHAALPAGAADIAAEIGTDAGSAAAIGATVMAVVMPLSIGFALLVKFIKKGTKG